MIRLGTMVSALLAAAACTSDAPTRIDAVVSVGAATGPSVVRLSLDVTALRDDGESIVREASIDPLRRGDRLVPWSTRVAPESALDVGTTVHRFRAVAVRADGAELVVQHRVTFLSGAVLTLPLRIDDACVDVACGANETCAEGTCVDDRIDPCTLEREDGTATHSACVRADAGSLPDAGDAATPDASLGPPTDPVVQISCGDHVSCARLESGQVRCWGDNISEILARDRERALSTATELELPARAIDVSAGMDTVCVVLEDGRVVCFGRPVGTGAVLPSRHGRFVDELAGATKVAATLETVCAIRDGRPVCLGHLDGAWSSLEGLVSIDAAWSTTCALDSMRRLQCWRMSGDLDMPITAVTSYGLGANGYAYVARGGGICGFGEAWFQPGVDRAAAGVTHCCMRVSTGADAGRVLCQGSPEEGALGAELEARPAQPVLVPGLDEVAEIDAGQFFACALRTDGTVWCWGTDEEGQLGDGSSGGHSAMPARVVGLP